jgi:hypothetical protein
MSLQSQLEAGVPGEPLILTYTVYITPEFETLDEYYENEYVIVSTTAYFDPDFYGGADLEDLAMTRAQENYDADRDETPVPMTLRVYVDDMESVYLRCKRIEDKDDFIAWD